MTPRRRRTATDRRLDAVINNAGIVQPPQQQAVAGFELQFGTNNLDRSLQDGALALTIIGPSDHLVIPDDD